MKTTQKGFIVPLLLIIVAILFTGGGAYFYMQTKTENPSMTENVTLPQATSTAQASNTQTAKIYSIPKCGVELTIKTNTTVTAQDITEGKYDYLTVWGYSIISEPKSNIQIECYARSSTSPKDVSSYLSVQSDGSSEVNKNDYPVFDQQTMSSITKLYSAKNRGYRVGSETIGFETKDWMYTFSFMSPDQAKNKDTFSISVVNPITQTSNSQTADWKMFTTANNQVGLIINDRVNFSFQYPSGWSVCKNVSPDTEYVTVSDDCSSAGGKSYAYPTSYFEVRNIGDADVRDLQAGILKPDTGWKTDANGGTELTRVIYYQSKNITLVLVATNSDMQSILDRIATTLKSNP